MRPPDFDTWPNFVFQSVLQSRTPFARFVRAGFTLQGPVCSRASAELFPIPVPFDWNPAMFHGQSRRKRHRWKRRRCLELLVNLQVAALNFLHGKDGRWCFGTPLNFHQQNVIDNLLVRARSLSRLGRTDFLRCGSKVAGAADELAALQVLLQSCEDFPYGVNANVSSKRNSDGTTLVQPTVAAKVAFPSTLQGFDPLPFLSEGSKLAYHKPSSLLGWRDLKPVRMMPPDCMSVASRSELLALGRRWDEVNRLVLALPEEIDLQDRCNLFCISKPDGELRQIIDRRPRNAREMPPPSDGPKMGHPSSFLGIVIPDNCNLLGSMDDLRNFYHEFVVSLDRAFSTPVGPLWGSNEWKGTKAFQQLLARHPKISADKLRSVFMCFGGLSMGDHWAPLIAQEAHECLLQSFGALDPDEHLKFGEILPRAVHGHFSGVCVDDKVSMQFVPKTSPNAPLRDTIACEMADSAYATAGLTYHPKKRVRRATVFQAWGAEIEGVEGLLGAKRSRMASLSCVTAMVAKSPLLTRHLLDTLLGCWAFVFQFRRPLFSIIQNLYHVSSPDGSAKAPFKIPLAVRQELQLLSILGSTALTSMRAPVSGTVFGTDASPDGAGLIGCKVGETVSAELFRRCETRGFHTRLLSPIEAHFHEKGCDGADAEASNDLLPDAHDPPVIHLEEQSSPTEPLLVPEALCGTVSSKDPRISNVAARMQASSSTPLGPSLQLRFDFLEVFAGCSRMTKAFADLGYVVGPPIELQRGWDVLESDLLHFLVGMCMSRRIAILWLGPPRTTFSLARSPKLRSSTQPLGFDPLHLDTLLENLFMHLSLILWLVQFWVGNMAMLETPWGAFTRHLPWWKFCLNQGAIEVKMDQCQFGTPHKKSTRILATHEALSSMSRTCKGDHVHERLEGSRTTNAAAYPFSMCQAVATMVHRVAASGVGSFSSRLPGSPCKMSIDDDRVVDADDHPNKNTNRVAPDHSLQDSKSSRRFVSHLWSTQLSESLPWKVVGKYRFKKPGHINVLECHARKTLALKLPPNHRYVVFQDSMVCLGSGAKGRSSSVSLNRVLAQEMTVLIAKDLYLGGAHTPTWSLRADDPSRRKKLSVPRCPVPKWFLCLRRGLLAQAQDALDENSNTPRSMGRWLLFGAAALLSAGGGHSSISSWAKASSSSKSSGPVTGTSHSCHSFGSSDPVPGICGVASTARPFAAGDSGSSKTLPDSGGGMVGRVRKASVREQLQPTELCGNHQCGPTAFSLLETYDGWTLAVDDNLGEPAPVSDSSSIAVSFASSDGCCSSELALDQSSIDAVARLFRFAETCRSVLAEGRRLHPQYRDWLCQRSVSQADRDKIANQRGSSSVRASRRAVRDCFFREMFINHAAERKDLAAYGKPV